MKTAIRWFITGLYAVCWDDKSSYGYYIGHEFEADLVGSASRGMRLNLNK